MKAEEQGTHRPWKVAVVGCGAVGSYYGARLWQTGAEVHFLLRSDYEAVCADGVRILSPQGDFVARPKCARVPEEIGPVDLVLIGLKTTANDRFERLVRPLVGRETAVLTLQNGLGNEEALARLFGPERILGGLCFVCLNRIAPGVIRHIAHGLVMLGEYGRPAGERVRHIAHRWEMMGVPCRVTDDLERAHWEKLVWNIPFNGLGVAALAGWEALEPGYRGPIRPLRNTCVTTEELLADPVGRERVRLLMREVIAAARALGHALEESLVEEMIARTRAMGPYKASTLLDYEKGLPLELESLFEEPRRRAARAGVATPHLDALCRVLRELDRHRPAHAP